jgi:hypothetical protein
VSGFFFFFFPRFEITNASTLDSQRRAEKAAEIAQRNDTRSQARPSSSYSPVDNLGPGTSHHSLPTRSPHSRPDQYRRFAQRPYSPPPPLEHARPSLSRRGSSSYTRPPISQRYDFESDSEIMMDDHRYYDREMVPEDYDARHQRSSHIPPPPPSRHSLRNPRAPVVIDDEVDYLDEEVNAEGEAHSGGSDEDERDFGPGRSRRSGPHHPNLRHGEPDYPSPSYSRDQRSRTNGRHRPSPYLNRQHGAEGSRQSMSHPRPSSYDRRAISSTRSAGRPLMDLDSPNGRYVLSLLILPSLC